MASTKHRKLPGFDNVIEVVILKKRKKASVGDTFSEPFIKLLFVGFFAMASVVNFILLEKELRPNFDFSEFYAMSAKNSAQNNLDSEYKIPKMNISDLFIQIDSKKSLASAINYKKYQNNEFSLVGDIKNGIGFLFETFENYFKITNRNITNIFPFLSKSVNHSKILTAIEKISLPPIIPVYSEFSLTADIVNGFSFLTKTVENYLKIVFENTTSIIPSLSRSINHSKVLTAIEKMPAPTVFGINIDFSIVQKTQSQIISYYKNVKGGLAELTPQQFSEPQEFASVYNFFEKTETLPTAPVSVISGITLFDRVTQEPYCLLIEEGTMKRYKGKCEEIDFDNYNGLIDIVSSSTVSK